MDDCRVLQYGELGIAKHVVVEHIECRREGVEISAEDDIKNVLLYQLEFSVRQQDFLGLFPYSFLPHAFEGHAKDAGIEIGLSGRAEKVSSTGGEFSNRS
jgi:hypothetical protein